jgi:hypothetical protein
MSLASFFFGFGVTHPSSWFGSTTKNNSNKYVKHRRDYIRKCCANSSCRYSQYYNFSESYTQCKCMSDK